MDGHAVVGRIGRCDEGLGVYVCDELLQCCVNRSVCLSASVYDHPSGRVGLAVLDGAAACTRLDTFLMS